MTLAICQAVSIDHHGRQRIHNYEDQFKQWMSKYERHYVDEKEYLIRLSNFVSNLATISEYNAKHHGRATFGLNQFSDLSIEEFRKTHLNYVPTHKKASQVRQHFDYPSNIPERVDWRAKGFVTPVKNQLQCGSCWAFSATEQIETAFIQAGNAQQFFSEQQIVDCDPFDGGCGGGDPMTAYQYVQSAGGITTDTAYPYTAQDGTCEANTTTKVAQIKTYGYASTAGNETQMKEAIAALGPLSICVDAETWMTYQSGIITTDCAADLDHCVQVVGYDVDTTSNIPYYIVRNSWGTTWGQEGYIYIGEGSNLCGITEEVTQVTVEAL
ncbi:hypothetical protein SAMD00019534_028850 [Acytostelium subglobosum LB1]|uniref:hypothetical protein n=1 Tax=Acytostelium subglobosum LB1 TaxID=1410327 RepID=UPI000644947E|nr:hypothetical protein SAMD00019534_028850 [Acytostelium subglobosum LB1]GAM19710.1 hypothetical protein SAMD00019534_028850 [Acytostelium subglobosum LB1]|eukprot:XP_012756472.1 hypothetical protein SAMD00019534_028850 [Acytostelium subglobosum LB1]